jgi:serine protease Do
MAFAISSARPKRASGTICAKCAFIPSASSFERVDFVAPNADLAILKFFAVDVPYLRLGSSQSAVEGQHILVIGNPGGLQGTVSDGLISAFREDRSYMQITAPISPGSSGSPVLDEEGKVIGVAVSQIVEG